MKRIYDNLLLLLLCLSGLCSCDDVMDTHKAFIQGGEIIYAPMPDTIFFVAGKNRVELNYEISKAPNVKFMKCKWSNGAVGSVCRKILCAPCSNVSPYIR